MPADRAALRAALERRGFAVRARTTRMHHGPDLPPTTGRVYSVFNLYWG
jgi:hypothetical protein